LEVHDLNSFGKVLPKGESYKAFAPTIEKKRITNMQRKQKCPKLLSSECFCAETIYLQFSPLAMNDLIILLFAIKLSHLAFS